MTIFIDLMPLDIDNDDWNRMRRPIEMVEDTIPHLVLDKDVRECLVGRCSPNFGTMTLYKRRFTVAECLGVNAKVRRPI